MKIKHKEGFTLIELLAVIVILAVIALIATPVVLNLIDSSQDSSNKVCIQHYRKALENEVVDENLSQEFNPTMCKIEDGKTYCTEYDLSSANSDVSSADYWKEIDVQMDGNMPESGIFIFEDNKISKYKATVDGTTISNINSSSTAEEVSSICKAADETTKAHLSAGQYVKGDKYNCNVDGTNTYTFYILSYGKTDEKIASNNQDVDGTINLIMNNHVGLTNNPLFTLNKLGEITANWYNVNYLDYTHDIQIISTGAVHKTVNIHGYARVMTYQELINAGCKIYELDTTNNKNSCIDSNTEISDSNWIYYIKNQVQTFNYVWGNINQNMTVTLDLYTANRRVYVNSTLAALAYGDKGFFNYTGSSYFLGIKPVINVSKSDLGL